MSNTTQNNHPTPNPTQPTIFTTKAIECSKQSSSCLHAANALLRSTISAVQNGTISPIDLAHAEAHSRRLTLAGNVLHALARVLLEDDSVALKSRLLHVDVSGSSTWTIEQAEEFIKTMKAPLFQRSIDHLLHVCPVEVDVCALWLIADCTGIAEHVPEEGTSIRDGSGEEIPEVLGDGVGLLDQGPGVRIDGEEEEVAGQITFDLVLRGARPGSNGP
ncbi:unnamed protein product [Zymoseptoria tritici ST99CH_3D7]|uniref:Uncharacterized protein n=1 Tax=Zymoseptoria tritici (strain ST99CH_3D7) TaxID=1276538 RepID=A0A1X7RT74_ZYMT9|nr:unnamed protein product [Zymoseptoria tritici ST99CH_3D7]